MAKTPVRNGPTTQAVTVGSARGGGGRNARRTSGYGGRTSTSGRAGLSDQALGANNKGSGGKGAPGTGLSGAGSSGGVGGGTGGGTTSETKLPGGVPAPVPTTGGTGTKTPGSGGVPPSTTGSGSGSGTPVMGIPSGEVDSVNTVIGAATSKLIGGIINSPNLGSPTVGSAVPNRTMKPIGTVTSGSPTQQTTGGKNTVQKAGASPTTTLRTGSPTQSTGTGGKNTVHKAGAKPTAAKPTVKSGTPTQRKTGGKNTVQKAGSTRRVSTTRTTTTKKAAPTRTVTARPTYKPRAI